jgi:hypothetical protein
MNIRHYLVSQAIIGLLAGAAACAFVGCMKDDGAAGDEGGAGAGGRGGAAAGNPGGGGAPGGGGGPGGPGDAGGAGRGAVPAAALVACPESSDDKKCRLGDYGTLGKGPAFQQTNDGVLGSGFVDAAGGRLVVTVGRIFENASKPRQGAVFAVDLATGDRTIVSGVQNDPMTGIKRVGEGPDFGTALNVKPGPDGAWYVFSRRGVGGEDAPESVTAATVTKVDPATGDRTEQWDLAAFDEPCGSIVQGVAFDGAGALYGIAANADDKFNGVTRIDLQAKSCEVISGPTAGGGVEVSRTLDALASGAGALWAVSRTDGSLLKIDPSDGQRVRVTGVNAGNQVGAGAKILPNGDLFVGESSVWAVGGTPAGTEAGSIGFSLVAIDPATGDRRAAEKFGDGPRVVDGATGVWALPGGDVIVAQNQELIVMKADSFELRNYFSY